MMGKFCFQHGNAVLVCLSLKHGNAFFAHFRGPQRLEKVLQDWHC